MGLGDALAADGPLPFAGETLYERLVRTPLTEAAEGNAFTGVNATALGFGLNDDALTFRRAVGEVGVSLLDGTGVVDLRPLKGGIGWMNNPFRFAGASAAFA